MEKTNFGEFREKELTGTNGLFNEFMRAFDLPISDFMTNDGHKVGPEARDYYDIFESGQKQLLALKDELQTFREDYYNQKSAVEIAKRITLDVEIVYPYVKKRTYTADGYQKQPVQTSISFEDFNKNSEVSFLSSFQILKDIQMDRRYKKIRDRIN